MVVVYFMMIPVIIGAIHGSVAIYHNPRGDTSVHLNEVFEDSDTVWST